MVVMASGCLPPERPELLRQPIMLGIRSEVVKPGAYSTGLVIPAGSSRADMLPLDTIELQWVTAFPAEPVPQAPIWLACPSYGDCDAGLAVYPLKDCADPLPLDRVRGCRLGTGERLQVTLAGIESRVVDYQYIYIQRFGAIGSGVAGLDPETCLARLQRRPREALEECLIGVYDAQLGPIGHLWTQLPEGTTLPIPLEYVPEELLATPPDFHPHVEIVVSREGNERVVADGAVVEVAGGDHVRVTLRATEESLQEYPTLRPDRARPGKYTLEMYTEFLYAAAYVTAEVEDYDDTGVLTLRWRVPPTPTPMSLYMWVDDTRAGVLPLILRFVPEPK